MNILPVKTPSNQYDIFIGADALSQIGPNLQKLGFQGRCALVSNATVSPHYAETVLTSLSQAGFAPVLCEIPDGEQHKHLGTVASLYEQFLVAGLDRTCPVLALGGGVLGDTVGFAAASFMRGLPFVQIPTTVLSMVDASVGGKTGVDLPQGKNLVGAFKQPEMVVVDPNVLQTLPPEEYRAGLAEVIKHGIISAPHLFSALEKGDYDITWMLTEAIKVKIEVVEEDPFEQGRRAVLNLGHTFAHAFEKIANFDMRHGDAVAMGMVCATKLAVNLGHCAGSTAEEIVALIEQVGLPIQHPGYPPDDVWQAMGADKKKVAGQLRFILPRAIGDVDIFADVPEAAVKEILT